MEFHLERGILGQQGPTASTDETADPIDFLSKNLTDFSSSKPPKPTFPLTCVVLCLCSIPVGLAASQAGQAVPSKARSVGRSSLQGLLCSAGILPFLRSCCQARLWPWKPLGARLGPCSEFQLLQGPSSTTSIQL